MDMNLILASIGVFLVVILLLVIILLVAKYYLVPSGMVKISINGGDKVLEVNSGSTLPFTFLLPAVVRALAVSARYRCSKVVVRYCHQRPLTLHASNSKTTGVWAVR